MKILLVNKFLYPRGGVETYILKLGEILKKKGHEVQYFGMYDEKNIVGNSSNLYVSKMDLRSKSIKNIFAPLKIISSKEARIKFMKVLNDFKPDVINFNNIEYYLTPSIILEASIYKKDSNVKLLYTAHDYQLICPSHGLFTSKTYNCTKCINGNYINCFKTKCLKNSRLKSMLGTIDAYYWKHKNVYQNIDTIICPSFFMEHMLNKDKRFTDKTVTIHNFVTEKDYIPVKKKNYILYFGALHIDKGVRTILKVALRHPEISFKFAGDGELKEEIKQIENAEYLGFKTGKELEKIISEAKISICPSRVFENCPFAVIESQMYHTPVIGANTGGIPELIKVGQTGELFESGNVDDLEKKILKLWNNKDLLKKYSENCKSLDIETEESYYNKFIKLCGDVNENI